MKNAVSLLLAVSLSMFCRAQNSYDSISISRFVERFAPNWPVTQADYSKYIREEKTIWIKPGIADTVLPPILQLTKEIQSNGQGAVKRCFIPRHSVNYYNEGRIVLYLLVCFQCDALIFTDAEKRNFLVSREARLKQMDELKEIFKEIRGK